MSEKIICKRCKNEIVGEGATSRRDNKTKICSICGNTEAMFDYTMYLMKQQGIDIKEMVELERKWLNNI